MKVYDKLIRDRIPEIIQAGGGKTCKVEEMNEAGYLAALKEKVLEEAEEVASAERQKLPQEIADLREVPDALQEAVGLNSSGISRLQRKRRAERGGFERRLRLPSVEAAVRDL